jgi:hypothetical protein
MKTSIQQSFAPVTIQITLESPQELYLYQLLVGSTLTVPQVLFYHDPLRENQLKEFMYKLHQEVSGL